MGRKAKPHYRSQHGHRGWYATVGGKKVHLVTGDKEATRAEAEAIFARMTGAVDPRVHQVMEVLRKRPDLIPAVLHVIEAGQSSSQLEKPVPATGVIDKLAVLKDAFTTVNWPGIAKAVMAGTLNPGAVPFLDAEVLKGEMLDLDEAMRSADLARWESKVFGTGMVTRPEEQYNPAVEGLLNMIGVKADGFEDMIAKLKHLSVLYPAGVGARVAEWKDAFSKVNWTELAHAVMDGKLKAGAEAFIDGETWKKEFLCMAPDAWKKGDHGWWERELFGTGKLRPEEEYKNAIEGLQEMFGLKVRKPEEIITKLEHLAVLYPAGVPAAADALIKGEP